LRRRWRRQADSLVEFDSLGVVGIVDLAGGFAPHVRAERTISLVEPMYSAFVQFWSLPRPYVNTADDMKAVLVPDKRFYETHFGAIQRHLTETYRHRIALIGDCGPVTLSYYILLRGMENALMDMFD